MPGTDTSAGLQLSLTAGGRRHDLVVPHGAQVTEVLAVLGIASRANPHAIATPSGRILGPHDVFDESVPTGSILTVVPVTTHAVTRDIRNLDRGRSAGGARVRTPGGSGARIEELPADPSPALIDDSTRRRADLAQISGSPTRTLTDTHEDAPSTGTERAPAAALPTQLIWLAAGFGAVISLVTLTVLGWPNANRAAPDVVWGMPAWLPVTASALLTLGAVGLAALSTQRVHRFAAAATAPALGLAAGLTLPLQQTPGRASVAVVLGCAVAILALAITRSRIEVDSPGDRTVLAAIGGLGLLVGVGTVLDWPGHAIAAIVTGLGPLLIRLLPTSSLTVDPNQLVDTDRLATTVWSVRERGGGRRKRVTRGDVSERFAAAREIVAIGTAYLSLTTAVGGWLLVLAGGNDTVTRWASVGALVAAALACGYQSRSVRDRLPRYSMLAACASLLLAAAQALIQTGWSGAALVLFLVATAIGWISVMAATALGRGYRSTRMSRFADGIETLTVALALPLGIVAAGGVEAIRRLTSG